MPNACRDALSTIAVSRAAHAGLLLDTLLREHDNPETRRGLLQAASSAAANAHPVYERAYKRWQESLPDASASLLRVDGRFVTGLGIETVLETGLRLHHTYGTLLIPGSSLKGLAAHYCAEVWGAADPQFAAGAAHHRVLFGTQDDQGALIFHDAWITPSTLKRSFVLDVMTPHSPDYYSAGKPPADTGNPNPISFLSITGVFFVVVSCVVPGTDGSEWSKLGIDLLKQALRDWGAGGKTRAGFGRLVS
jgi:CRISPR-associated protein Cmr6